MGSLPRARPELPLLRPLHPRLQPLPRPGPLARTRLLPLARARARPPPPYAQSLALAQPWPLARARARPREWSPCFLFLLICLAQAPAQALALALSRWLSWAASWETDLLGSLKMKPLSAILQSPSTPVPASAPLLASGAHSKGFTQHCYPVVNRLFHETESRRVRESRGNPRVSRRGIARFRAISIAGHSRTVITPATH